MCQTVIHFGKLYYPLHFKGLGQYDGLGDAFALRFALVWVVGALAHLLRKKAEEGPPPKVSARVPFRGQRGRPRSTPSLAQAI
jgi:hypothetical protein